MATKIPEVTQRINNLGASVIANSPEEFSRQITKESEYWTMVTQKIGLNPN